MASIYIHINKINNKKYVGISKYSDPSSRWGENGEHYMGQAFYDKGIKQFGWNNFEHIILNDDLTLTQAEQIEARLIKNLNLTDFNCGYNESAGVRIIEDNVLDVLAQNLAQQINKDSNTNYIPKVGYDSSTVQYDIRFLNEQNKLNRINTELDCQRAYVWDESRQQGLWDTLIFGHRIPELHAKTENLIYSFLDGKQRLTTILQILDNKIPYLKTSAVPETLHLFKDNRKIYFKDLPKYLQERILDTKISVALYENLSDEDLILLFKKLNASKQLSNFGKEIASNPQIRIFFTQFLVNHKTIKKFLNTSTPGDEDEKLLCRILALLTHSELVSLDPSSICSYFENYNKQELKEYTQIIKEFLDKIYPYVDILLDWRARKSFFPLVAYICITSNYSEKNIEDFFNNIANEIKKPNHLLGGRGKDQSVGIVEKNYEILMQLAPNILKDFDTKLEKFTF